MSDEEIWYMDEYYQDWLKSGYSYHFGCSDDVGMHDTFWDGLARLYVKCLQRYPFLNQIDFDGSTLGVGVDKELLLAECGNPKINKWVR